MFIVNGLANYLPLNGLTTGDVSALYPNKFVPDGFTFSIWSIIYLWLLVFLGYTTNILIWLPGVDHRYDRIISILPLFWFSCLLNASWIISWHYLQVLISLIIMLLLLFTLFSIYKKLQINPAQPRKRDHLLVEVPFYIYFGWISVATIANTTALLVHHNWLGGPLSESTWSIIMMAIAAVLGIWMSLRHHRPAFTLVIIWALLGIQRSQGELFPAVEWAAIIGAVLCLAATIPELLRPKKGWNRAA
jgi:translocator protein